VNPSDEHCIFAAVESSFKYNVIKQKNQMHKFSLLKKQQLSLLTLKITSGSQKFVLNLLYYDLTEAEVSIFKTWLNFAVTHLVFSLVMAFVAEYVGSKLPLMALMEFSWKIRSALEKAKRVTSSMSRMESTDLKSLKLNKEIRIMQADTENCVVVLNDSTYKKIFSLLESGIYEALCKKRMYRLRGKYRNFYSSASQSFLPT
jgi:hypothetical protein